MAQEEINKGFERVYSKHIDDLRGWIEEPRTGRVKPMKEARETERSNETLKEILSISGPAHLVTYPRAKFFTLMHEVADSLHGYSPAATTKEPATADEWHIHNRETICTTTTELPAVFDAACKISPIRQFAFRGDPEKVQQCIKAMKNGKHLEMINGQLYYTVKDITEEKQREATREVIDELDDKMWEYGLSAKIFCDKVVS